MLWGSGVPGDIKMDCPKKNVQRSGARSAAGVRECELARRQNG